MQCNRRMQRSERLSVCGCSELKAELHQALRAEQQLRLSGSRMAAQLSPTAGSGSKGYSAIGELAAIIAVYCRPCLPGISDDPATLRPIVDSSAAMQF